MTDNIEEIHENLSEKSPIAKLIKKWKDEEDIVGFNAAENLRG